MDAENADAAATQAPTPPPKPAPAEPEEKKDAPPQTQEEIKNEAVAHLKAIRLTATMLEDELKITFHRYDAHTKGFWTLDELRVFLFDLLESFEIPRVVTTEALMKILQELQLTSEQQVVKWVDFKSYCMYLQQQPFAYMKDQILSLQGSFDNAVIVQKIPAEATVESLAEMMSAFGTVDTVFLVTNPRPQALIRLDSKESVEGAVKALTGTADNPVQAIAYTVDVQFPAARLVRQPRGIHRGLAKIYVGAKNFDEKHQITAKIKAGAHTVSQKLNQVSADLKLQERTQAAKESAKGLVQQVDQKLKISETATRVNEKYNISGRATEAAEQAKRNIQIGLASQPVQKGLGFLTRIASAVQESVSEFTDTTRSAIDNEQRRTQAS